ncbi:hypothetical protein ASE63_20530 [Bosea sp. Root381]|uniref:hypothetical protein n=1 Tax=Bosea sp. Root381 TaxID=1736524 RepID=UPI0006FE1B9C|nr:hypothetical protein [Bosea sp. Root381]KRE11341.1 hypothetical protein ASE63_20530 [Bosea sp. Root381]
MRLDRGRAPSGTAASPFASFAMFKRPEIRRLLGMLLFIEIGLVLPYGMKPVLQVDAGLSMATIGLIGVIGGNLAGIAGAGLAKPLVDRVGAWRVLAVILALTAAMDTILAFALVRPTPAAAIGFVLASSLLSFGYFTASRTLILGVCDPRQGATELSTFLCIGNAFVLGLASLGNLIAGQIGTQFLFATAAIFASLSLMFVL